MSLKRPLSPESNDNLINNDKRQLKRLKLHSIIQQLRNEEAKLVLLKKLRTSQQISTRTNKNSSTISNGTHPTATRLPTTNILPIIPPTKTLQLPVPNFPPQQQTATRKTSNSPLLTTSNKISSNQSNEERKNQAKATLRKQLERDLLNIPSPKPSLQDVLFIPNGTSLEFQPLIGLEDVIQCLNELQTDRHRLPQRFTDHAQIDEPYICDQCGTDFTIRWWKHLNLKSSNEILNILCDRCKKQVVRRTSKSEHSTLLKNVFLSAMKQEKEIEKTFHSLIKQEKNSSRAKSSIPQQIQSIPPPPTNHQYQMKSFATKIFQQPTRKSNTTVQSQNHHSNVSRTVQQQQQRQKTSMSIQQYHQHQQQQLRAMTGIPQQTKNHSTGKVSKSTTKQQTVLPSSHPIFPPHPDIFNAFLASNLVKPTSSKRRTFPTVELK